MTDSPPPDATPSELVPGMWKLTGSSAERRRLRARRRQRRHRRHRRRGGRRRARSRRGARRQVAGHACSRRARGQQRRLAFASSPVDRQIFNRCQRRTTAAVRAAVSSRPARRAVQRHRHDPQESGDQVAAARRRSAVVRSHCRNNFSLPRSILRRRPSSTRPARWNPRRTTRSSTKSCARAATSFAAMSRNS